MSEWISVKDRLPENEDFVLVSVTGRFHHIKFENAPDIASFCREGWILESCPEWSNPGVTHWMPLPEMPK